MQQYQILESELADIFWVSQLIKEGYDITVVNSVSEINPNITVITKSDLLCSHVRNWLSNNQPAIYLGRGYVGNHLYKSRNLWTWRASVNGWANTKLNPIPYSRWDLMNLPKHSWKVSEIKNVLIAPSKMTSPVWEPEIGDNWAEHMAQQFPGADVKIRLKPRKPGIRWSTLWQDLDWADLVVSQSSAITCEAFWYGKKVISIYPCPTWAAGKTTLADWQDPTEPSGRDEWHEHIAWSQYSKSEWESGQAIKLFEQYVGTANTYPFTFSYNF